MAQIHGRNSVLHIWDNSGASQNATGDMTSVTMSWSRDNPAATNFGDDSVQRISGVRDVTLTGAIVWNSGTNTVTNILSTLASGSTMSLVRWLPGGCTTGSPQYTACMLLSAYEENATMDGPVTATFTFQLASGSLTASTV